MFGQFAVTLSARARMRRLWLSWRTVASSVASPPSRIVRRELPEVPRRARPARPRRRCAGALTAAGSFPTPPGADQHHHTGLYAAVTYGLMFSFGRHAR